MMSAALTTLRAARQANALALSREEANLQTALAGVERLRTTIAVYASIEDDFARAEALLDPAPEPEPEDDDYEEPAEEFPLHEEPEEVLVP